MQRLCRHIAGAKPTLVAKHASRDAVHTTTAGASMAAAILAQRFVVPGSLGMQVRCQQQLVLTQPGAECIP